MPLPKKIREYNESDSRSSDWHTVVWGEIDSYNGGLAKRYEESGYDSSSLSIGDQIRIADAERWGDRVVGSRKYK